MNFSVRSLELPDLVLVEERHYHDNRGYFVETWTRPAFAELGIDADFVQDNMSLSLTRGTLRGLHYQKAAHAQAKLVRVVSGSILDVVVDIREKLPTFGRSCSVVLTAGEGKQLFVPKGFAHGFMTLVDDTIVSYKADSLYHPASDAGIVWNDPELAIPWPIPEAELIVSVKDRQLPRLRDRAV
jgi:dTDP-4-dehydrorhamnose 3,5-epimerase